MTDLPHLLVPGTDHTATTCLACGAEPQIGHLPRCPALRPDATELLVESLSADTNRTWMLSGLRYNLTPARRRRFATKIPSLRWVRPVDKPRLPASTSLLLNEILPKLGFERHVAAVGVNAAATVRVADCPCTDPWRCRCDFPDHPFRFAHPDLWCDFGLLGLKVRFQTGWSWLWLLDNGMGAIFVAEDFTAAAPPTYPITRRCYLGWCDTCPGQVKTAPDAEMACTCPCHRDGRAAEPTPG